jgi:putative membrane protein
MLGARASALLAAAGLAATAALVLWHEAGEIGRLLAGAGGRLGWLVPVYTVSIVAGALAWRLLFPPGTAPGLRGALLASWLGLAVNWLLPVAQVGGELLRARLAWRAGTPGPAAVASVVVDKTAQAVSLLLLAMAGLALLPGHGGLAGSGGPLGAITLLGAAVFAFYRVQRAGLFGWLGRAGAARFAWGDLAADAGRVDRALGEIYERRGACLAALALRLAGRAAQVAETWLALRLLGHPVGLSTAMVLEGLTQVVVGAAFVVPGQLGVQEGSFLSFGVLLGVAPPAALALALAKRARELALGVPGLLVWGALEGRWLLRVPRPRRA